MSYIYTRPGSHGNNCEKKIHFITQDVQLWTNGNIQGKVLTSYVTSYLEHLVSRYQQVKVALCISWSSLWRSVTWHWRWTYCPGCLAMAWGDPWEWRWVVIKGVLNVWIQFQLQIFMVNTHIFQWYGQFVKGHVTHSIFRPEYCSDVKSNLAWKEIIKNNMKTFSHSKRRGIENVLASLLCVIWDSNT